MVRRETREMKQNGEGRNEDSRRCVNGVEVTGKGCMTTE